MPDLADQALEILNHQEAQWGRSPEPKPYDCYVLGVGHVVIDATSPSECIEKLETLYGAGKPGQDDFAFRVPPAHHKSGEACRGSASLIDLLKQQIGS